MNILSRVLIVATALMPGAVLADAANFNYVEAKFLTGEVLDLDADGWGVQASVALGSGFFVNAEVNDQEIDERNFSADYKTRKLGLGYVFLEDSVLGVLFGRFSLVDVDSDLRGPRGRYDDSGWALGFGARFDLNPRTELRLGVDYADYAHNDAFVPSVGLVHDLNSRLALMADLSSEEDGHTAALGLRFYF